jgi:hypothetical protein
MFSGIFMKGFNQGLTIAPHLMKQLGERGLELGLDIYDDDEH